ncbi:MAG: glycosyltransferase [Clostridia bacterium]|nr:glycosyltransferase [Clostridia bacterium]
MKKICILQNDLAFGGTDTFVLNLCQGLICDNYDVTVVLSIDKQKIALRESELTDLGVNIVKTSSLQGGLKSKLKHLVLLYKELKKGKYDVFQTNIDLFNGPQMFIAWLAKIPVRVCHSHNSQQGRELREGRTFSVKLYQGIMRWLCWQFSNRRCGCSKAALDFLFGDKWKKDPKARVIHNGIDLSEYSKKFDFEEKKRELGLTNTYNISTVGRISFQKNPEFLLEIFYELSKIRGDVDLVWCGKGELESVVKKQINDFKLDNRVHLLGTRNDIPEILCCSDVFLLPSRFEGLGIVLVEAQAAKLPCIMSDVIPKEVDCGLCLSLSLEQSAEHWAKQISNILDGNCNLDIDREKIDEYSIEHMIKEMEEVFE